MMYIFGHSRMIPEEHFWGPAQVKSISSFVVFLLKIVVVIMDRSFWIKTHQIFISNIKKIQNIANIRMQFNKWRSMEWHSQILPKLLYISPRKLVQKSAQNSTANSTFWNMNIVLGIFNFAFSFFSQFLTNLNWTNWMNFLLILH